MSIRLPSTALAQLRELGHVLARRRPYWPDALDRLFRWRDDGSLWYALRLLDRTIPRHRRAPTLAHWRGLLDGQRSVGLRAIHVLDLRWYATLRPARRPLRHRFRPPRASLATFEDIVGALGSLGRFYTDPVGSGRDALRHLEVLARHHPGLRHLELVALRNVGASELHEVLDWFVHLERLSLPGCSVAPFELFEHPRTWTLREVRMDLTPRQRQVLHVSGAPVAPPCDSRAAVVLRQLDPPVRPLWAGDEDDRAVLRDLALQLGLEDLAAAV